MATPLPTSTHNLLVNTDVAVQVAQYAAGLDVPVECIWIDPTFVHVHALSIEGGRQLARALRLDLEQVDSHPHGNGVKVSVRWRSDGSPVSISFRQQGASVARVVA